MQRWSCTVILQVRLLLPAEILVSPAALVGHFDTAAAAAGVWPGCDQVLLAQRLAVGAVLCHGQPSRLVRGHPDQQGGADHHPDPEADAGHCQPGPRCLSVHPSPAA